MDSTQKLSTNEILEKLEADEEVSEMQIDFPDTKTLRSDIYRDISERFSSQFQCAQECHISPSFLNEFLNSNKHMRRDKLLCLCIGLEYDIAKTRAALRRGRVADLYPRDARDYLILNALRLHTSLDELNEQILARGFDPLYEEDTKRKDSKN